MTNNRNPIIDALKGFAILLVIFNHVKLNGLLTGIFIGVFHMPLFFIISGYLYKRRSLKDTIIRNSSKILLPYFITCCLIWGILIIERGDWSWGLSILWGNSKPLLGGSIKQPLLEYSSIRVGPLWFLTTYFCSMIYAFFLLKISSKVIRWTIIVFLFHLSIVCVKFTGFMLPFGLTTAFGGVCFLFVGIELKENPMMIEKKAYLCFGITIWALCVIFGNCVMASHKYQLYVLQIIGGLYGTYICYKLLNQLNPSSFTYKVLCYIGENSLSFMCIHSIDRTLGITKIVTNAIFEHFIKHNDVLYWQTEIFLKIVFVIILFCVFRRINLLKNIYDISERYSICHGK